MIIKDGKYVPEKLAVQDTIGFSIHAEETRKALIRKGCSFTKDNEADLVLHQCPSHIFKRINKLPNVLYTAYETEDLPEEYIKPLKDVDKIVTVSNFVKDVYKKYTDKEIDVCNLGVNTNVFKYKKRARKNVFRFLWIGAPNERKGWKLIQEVWKKYFLKYDNIQLYMKTTGRNKLESFGNAIMDSRFFTVDQMVELYHSADAFLFPSFGEGFGLPLAEAMSTGLPCVHTPYGGVLDFANKKNSYPVAFSMRPVKYKIDTKGAYADIESIKNRMVEILDDPKEAIRKGKKAAKIIKSDFTWDHTGSKMKTILKNLLKENHGKLYR